MTTAAPIRTVTGRFAAAPTTRDELFTLWAVATAEANLAFDVWGSSPGGSAYAAFVAADDRAAAAQDALAAFAG